MVALAGLMVAPTSPVGFVRAGEVVDPCGGPDAFGYRCYAVDYDFDAHDIRASGTLVPDADHCDDCVSPALPLGFNFTFYGENYSQVYVSSNGFLTFTEDDNDGCCDGQHLPDLITPDNEGDWPHNLVAAYWTDLDSRCWGDLRSQQMGEAPDRTFVVQWTGIDTYSCGNEPFFNVTMQIILHENSNIEIQLADAPSDYDRDHAHVTGIENATGSSGLTYGYDDDSDGPGYSPFEQAVVFVPPDGSVPPAKATPPTPTITLDPAEPNGLSGYYNSSVTATFGAEPGSLDVDASTLAYSFNGNSFVPVPPSPPSITITDDGETELWALVNDTQGNTGTTGPTTLLLDTTAPTSGFELFRDGSTDPAATVVITFSEPMDPQTTLAAIDGIDGWDAAWNGGPCDCGSQTPALDVAPPNSELTLTRSGLDPGTYDITIGTGARDGHGVHFPEAHTFSFAVDAPPTPEAPVTTLTLDPASANEATGWFTTAPSVTLSATPEGATIHYAIDGADEVTYEGSFTMPVGMHTLHYRATAADHPDEDAQTIEIDVDDAAPVFGDLVFAPGNPVRGDDVTLSLPVFDDISGVATVTLRAGDVDLETSWDGHFANATLPDVAAGSIVIRGNATDVAGNERAFEDLATIDVTEPPTPDAPLGLTVEFVEDHFHLEWTAPVRAGDSPILRYDIYRSSPCDCAASALDAPAPYATTTNTSYNDSDIEPGTSYSYSVAAVNDDGAGPATPPSEYAIAPDTNAPVTTLAIDPESPSGWYTAPPTITFTATPDGATIHYAIDDGESATYDGPFQPSIAMGEHTLTYYATASDRPDEPPRTVDINVDDVAPEFGTLSTDPTAPQADSDVELNLLVGDAGSGISSVTINVGEDTLETSWNGHEATAVFHAPSAGTFTVHATATDVAGNSNESDVGTFDAALVDTAAPDVSIALDPSDPTGLGVWYVTPVTANITATDDDGVDGESFGYSTDGGESFTGGSTFAFPDGVTTLTARASDLSGNVGTTSRTVHVDLTSPTVAPGGSSGTLTGTSATITFTFSEPMSSESVLAALSGATGFTPTWNEGLTRLTLAASDLAPGTHTLTVGTDATDAHGRALAAPASRSVTVSAPPPPEPPGAPPGQPTGVAATADGGPVHVSWAAPASEGTSPITSYHVYRHASGQPNVLFATVSGLAFDDAAVGVGDTYVYAVAAVNAVGEGQLSDGASVTIPAPAPPTSGLALAPAAPDGEAGWYLSPPTATLTATPSGAQIRYHLDAGPDENYTAPFAVPIGAHTIHWHAELSGAPSEAEHTQDVFVDGAPPALGHATLSAPNATIGGSVHLDVGAADDASGIASVVALLSDGSSIPLSGSGGDFGGSLGPAAVGSYSVDVLIADHAGRTTRQTVGSFTIDAIPVEEPPIVTPTVTTTPTTPTSGGSSSGSGSGGGSSLEHTSVSSTPASSSTTTTSTPPPTPPSPVVTVTPVNASIDLAAGARGALTVSVQNAAHPDQISFVAVGDDGSVAELGSGTSATWDTTSNPDGYYTIEARERQSDGTNLTIASARVLVRNTFVSATGAAATLALGVGAAAATTIVTNALTSAGSSAATSVVTSSGSGGFSFTSYLKDLFVDAGSDTLRNKTKDIAALERRRKIRSAVAVVVTVGLIAVFYSVAVAKPVTWSSVLEQLPFVGLAAVILAVQKYSTESLIAHATGVRVRFRLWIAGVLSLLASTLVFHEPFGYPGYVDNGTEETESEKRLAGHRALAILAGTAGWGLVFILIGHVGYYGMANIGLAMAVTVLATSAMPFGPLPGAEVWRWNKLASLGVAAAALAIYVTYQMAIIPEWAYVAIGAMGALSYVATTVYYRNQRKRPTRVPVRDADAAQKAKDDARTSVELK